MWFTPLIFLRKVRGREKGFRKVELVTEQLMYKEFSSASISRFSATLDAELDAWRVKSFTKECPYAVVDSPYESCRLEGKIFNIAALITIGIDSEDYRHLPGIETAWSETGDSLGRFIGGLKERGLRGILKISTVPWLLCSGLMLIQEGSYVRFPNPLR